MQVDPIKLTLKAPGSERLKLKYDNPLSDFPLSFDLRRYMTEAARAAAEDRTALEKQLAAAKLAG